VLFVSAHFSVAGDGDCLEERPLSRMKQIESTRALRRKRQEFSLEESWTSLDLFNRCQKGRISFDIQGLYLPVSCSYFTLMTHEIVCVCGLFPRICLGKKIMLENFGFM
jgi:hypothetical protein